MGRELPLGRNQGRFYTGITEICFLAFAGAFGLLSSVTSVWIPPSPLTKQETER
jgi:hypothetical protein